MARPLARANDSGFLMLLFASQVAAQLETPPAATENLQITSSPLQINASPLRITSSPAQAPIATNEVTQDETQSMPSPRSASAPPSTSLPTSVDAMAVDTPTRYMTRQRAARLAANNTTPPSPSPKKVSRKSSPPKRSASVPSTQRSAKHKTSSNRKRAKSVPTKDRPKWKCTHPGCPQYIFPRRHDIARHEKTHLPDALRPYHCDWPGCGFTAVQQGNLRTHMATHEGQCTPCDELLEDGTSCPFKCTDPGQMTRHKQKKHDWPSRAGSQTSFSTASSISGGDDLESAGRVESQTSFSVVSSISGGHDSGSVSSTPLSTPPSSPEVPLEEEEIMLVGPDDLPLCDYVPCALPLERLESFTMGNELPEYCQSPETQENTSATFYMPFWA